MGAMNHHRGERYTSTTTIGGHGHLRIRASRKSSCAIEVGNSLQTDRGRNGSDNLVSIDIDNSEIPLQETGTTFDACAGCLSPRAVIGRCVPKIWENTNRPALDPWEHPQTQPKAGGSEFVKLGVYHQTATVGFVQLSTDELQMRFDQTGVIEEAARFCIS
ncbi:hypothetical protein PVAR5_4281 [Paecilomyces variotii No. 5]|uniref:Uncharacterized protein n=1 Tax=Byssochlamys spectabilis (strain No. 5 / NBRC 109023) TaxID=1356009 RepID=V5HZW9_BYSSN|nr:hypothetical protein PVAR5_4281 [Paecilomyces variotii No. 5]